MTTLMNDHLVGTVATLPLVDGHCHFLLDGPVDASRFELACSESRLPAPAGISYLDGAVGLAIRRWCPPALDLPPGVPMSEYLERRTTLGADEVARRLLRRAGLSHLLIDTGLADGELTSLSRLGSLSGADVGEVVRLETVAEQLASEEITGAKFASAYVDSLIDATRDAVAVKSIVAYRHGFAIDPGRPTRREVEEAAGEWLGRPGKPRVDHPVLLRFLLWSAIDRGLPIQIHSGFGDRDVHLPQADPAVLQPFLAGTESSGVPMVLLHCYPYHRQAGWLAQVYRHVYLDVGLTIAQVGARADGVLAEFFELAPFGKLLFSTDGYALPELYLVGAAQFRHSLSKLFSGWVADDAIRSSDAERLAAMVGALNAKRLYGI
jgi:predicted TIM-barrel fold metal-dependent hydrolase